MEPDRCYVDADKPLRFHWRLAQGGEKANASRASNQRASETGLPDLESQIEFCRSAEACGIDSLLVAFGYYMPDPMLLSAALGLATDRIRFMIAYRSGVISPVLFVQQLNTLSALIKGRLSLNIVAGHSPGEQRSYGDFLEHDERYARTDEFLEICNSLWACKGPVTFSGKHYQVENAALNTPFLSGAPFEAGISGPEIYVGGNSEQAGLLAKKRASCWLRFPDAPEKMAPLVRPALEAGKEVGLRVSVIARSTRAEAVRAAYSLVEGSAADSAREKGFVERSDSTGFKENMASAESDEWPTPVLWLGGVRTLGVAAAALVGTPEEVATAIIDYKRVGISQFVLSGWPKLGEMVRFGSQILPLVRAKETSAGVRPAKL